ncbi:MAG: Ig-like domain-containing protein, partial [Chitinispirillaceae bacterium]|nr:Ig-like domain-containing protein [Chitinispirillaceae bacterium]
MSRSVMTRKSVGCAFAAALLFSVTCTLELGDAPIGPTVIGPGEQDTTVTITIETSRTQLVADGLDTATITVTLRDNLGHAMTGEQIDFTTNDVGSVGSPGIIDQSGACRVTLTSAQVNDTCRVTARARNWNVWDSVSVVFSGVHLSLQANPAALRVAVDTTVITGQLLDGSNRVIGQGDPVVFRTRAGTFTNGDTVVSTVFNAAGQAAVRMYSNTFGTVMVYATAASITDSIAVDFDSTSVPVVGSRLFTLYSSKTQLKADNNDMATIIAMVMDENHNPATGDIITFSCNLGMIGDSAVVDEYGNAVTWVRARPVNGTCVITAVDETSGDTASTSVLFSGVTIQLESSATNLNLGETAVVTARLKDGSGNAIGGDTVVFSTAAPGVFGNGGITARSFLDPTGLASVTFSSNSIGRVFIGASCLNTRDTIELFFTNNAITLTASKDPIIVGGADSSLLTAEYLDSNNAPVSGQLVVFYANAGTITQDSVYTDAGGHASTWLKSADFTGIATVEASTEKGNALAWVAFAAATIKRIKLAITPDNI